MKKGQIQGQVFIYILTLIITAGILIYGYNAIKKLNATSGQVQLVDFKTKLKADIETISSDYGSVKTKTYNVPSNVKKICFYQNQEGDYVNYPSYPDGLNPLILDSIDDKTGNNVFVMGNSLFESMKLARIEVIDGPMLCIETNNNRLKLRLEGKGDGVLVEKA